MVSSSDSPGNTLPKWSFVDPIHVIVLVISSSSLRDQKVSFSISPENTRRSHFMIMNYKKKYLKIAKGEKLNDGKILPFINILSSCYLIEKIGRASCRE